MALDVIRLISNMSNMILSVLSNATWLRTDNALGGKSCYKYIKLENVKKKSLSVFMWSAVGWWWGQTPKRSDNTDQS